MSSVAEAAARLGGRHRLVWVALALSLTLNVFFLAGLVWSKMAAEQPMSPAQRFQELGRELALDPKEGALFETFGRTVRDRGRALRQANEPLLERIWAELAKPNPDEALIAGLLEQASENRRAFQKATATALTDFLRALTPEQRAQFADLARRRQDAAAHRIWRMILP
jgi:Spy/CpxP family protein refolding chaperone